MIETKFATEQLERLSGLSFFPKPIKGDTASQAAFRELRLALECATSGAVAKRVVDNWIREATEAPKPADLRKMVYDENDRIEREERAQYRPPTPIAMRCQRCQDTGVVESTDGGVESVASACCCERSAKPDLIDKLNGARRRLSAMGMRGLPTPSFRRAAKMRTVAEVYNGEY